MLIKKKLNFAPLLVLMLSFVNCYAKNFNQNEINHDGLTTVQAEYLLKLAFKHDKYDLSKKGMYIDRLAVSPEYGYIGFGLYYDNPKDGAVTTMGAYDVNLKTGDVWDLRQCSRYKFPELIKLQKIIIGKTFSTMPEKEVIQDKICDNPPEQ